MLRVFNTAVVFGLHGSGPPWRGSGPAYLSKGKVILVYIVQ